jgi:hypothetical protein
MRSVMYSSELIASIEPSMSASKQSLVGAHRLRYNIWNGITQIGFTRSAAYTRLPPSKLNLARSSGWPSTWQSASDDPIARSADQAIASGFDREGWVA